MVLLSNIVLRCTLKLIRVNIFQYLYYIKCYQTPNNNFILIWTPLTSNFEQILPSKTKFSLRGDQMSRTFFFSGVKQCYSSSENITTVVGLVENVFFCNCKHIILCVLKLEKIERYLSHFLR